MELGSGPPGIDVNERLLIIGEACQSLRQEAASVQWKTGLKALGVENVLRLTRAYLGRICDRFDIHAARGTGIQR